MGTPNCEKNIFLTNIFAQASIVKPIVNIQQQKHILQNLSNTYNLGIKQFQQAQQATNDKIQYYSLAAQSLASVLRPVLSKPTMRQLKIEDCSLEVKQQLLDSLEHLGYIHLNNKDCFNNHAKAAAIYQYCSAFTEQHNIQKLNNTIITPQYYKNKAFKVEQEFLEHLIADDVPNVINISNKDNSIKYKQQLQQIKNKIRQSLQAIDENPAMQQMSSRAKIIEHIYEDCTNLLIGKQQNISQQNNVNNHNKGLLQSLLQDCFGQIGYPPCDYAIVGFGSLGGGRMTPWSDLEFTILIDENTTQQQQNNNKEYFRNLTKLLHIKVINLGDTPLRTAAVDVLNNFRSGEEADDWFWDEYISKGFTFDALNWSACKTPLGRQGNYIVKHKVKSAGGLEQEIITPKREFELICTPKQLSEFQAHIAEDTGATTEQSWYDTDMHLVQALRLGGSLIYGNQNLLNQYRQWLIPTSIESQLIIKSRLIKTLHNNLESFRLKLSINEEGKLYDVKQDIFRIADRIVDGLALYYNATAKKGEAGTSPWQMIDDMAANQHLSLEGAQHLKEAISIATELRLRTYSHNNGQRDSFSTYQPAVIHLDKQQRKKLIEQTFYIKDTKILHHFYYVMIAVQKIADSFCNEQYHDMAILNFKKHTLLQDDSYTKALVHARFFEYNAAIEYLQQAKIASSENPEKYLDILVKLYRFYRITGDMQLDFEAEQEQLKSLLEKHKDNFAHPAITTFYNYIGNISFARNDYIKAIKHYTRALTIAIVYKNSMNIWIIAALYNNIGNAYFTISDHEKAMEYYNKALDIILVVYKDNLNHPAIAVSCNNIGVVAYHAVCDYERAIKYYDQALAIKLIAYKNSPNHPTIANSYHKIGDTYSAQGNYGKAIENYNKALAIKLVIHQDNPKHRTIAVFYDKIGNIYSAKGDYVTAIEYYYKALAIFEVSNDFQQMKLSLLLKIALKLQNNIISIDNRVNEAWQYYQQLNDALKNFHFADKLAAIEAIFHYSFYEAAVVCLQAIIALDPNLQHGNHYHKLACIYASNQKINAANETFIKALQHSPKANLYVEYAQFLIINGYDKNIRTNPEIIIQYLYAAINSSNSSKLEYSKIALPIISDLLKESIIQHQSTIKVHPKILAYYLLATQLKYIELDPLFITNMVDDMQQLCEYLQDDISYCLLSNVYKILDNQPAAQRYLQQAELLYSAKTALTLDSLQKLNDQHIVDMKEININVDQQLEVKNSNDNITDALIDLEQMFVCNLQGEHLLNLDN